MGIGLHEEQPPCDFRMTRLEYEVFPLNVFRKHIQQELRGPRESSYWLARRNKKKTAADYIIR
jgi:hypothetical protein